MEWNHNFTFCRQRRQKSMWPLKKVNPLYKQLHLVTQIKKERKEKKRRIEEQHEVEEELTNERRHEKKIKLKWIMNLKANGDRYSGEQKRMLKWNNKKRNLTQRSMTLAISSPLKAFLSKHWLIAHLCDHCDQYRDTHWMRGWTPSNLGFLRGDTVLRYLPHHSIPFYCTYLGISTCSLLTVIPFLDISWDGQTMLLNQWFVMPFLINIVILHRKV